VSTTRHRRRPAAVALIAIFLLTLLPALPVAADSTAQTLPFIQRWTDTTQITANDNWSGVPGIVGFLGQDITTATATDPRTLLTDSVVQNDVDVIANLPEPNITNGGVGEFEIANPVVALQGSGTADAPYLLINIQTTGLTNVPLSYVLRDIDETTDNAIQPVALQYRVGSSGAWTNIPAGYVPDATTGPSLATLTTPISAILPAAADNQALVQIRIITSNAVGNDEWVGIDNISIGPDEPPDVQSTIPADGANDVALDADLSVTFSEPVNVDPGWFAISCATSSNHSATVSGGPTTFSINPDADFVFDETCTLTVSAQNVTDQDLIDPPDLMAADHVSTFQTAAPPPTPSEVVISEVYGGGGNSGATLKNDFIELYNRTDHSISLAGWSVQYASAAGTTWQVTSLTGTIAAGRNYLVKEAAGAGGTVDLPPPDATGPIAMSATAGKVALVSTATALTGACPTGLTISDFVGYGPTATCFEGTGPTGALSNTTAALRNGDGATDTDNNAADFTVGTPDPHASADQAPTVSSTTPANGATGVPLAAPITVTFSEPVTVAAGWYTISCATSGAHTATVTGGPSTFTLDPDADFDADESCTVTILASAVTDMDAEDPPDTMAANYVFTFQTADVLVCGAAATSIHTVQGSGLSSPLVGTGVTIEGIVVGDYQDTPSEFGGFYLQEETAQADADPLTSEGVFVFDNGSGTTVQPGDLVRARGTVAEFQGLTELNAISGLTVCSTGNPLPAATPVSLPVQNVTDLEAFEGMLVQFDQTLTATEVFNLGRFGEVSLSGAGRLYTGTAVADPGPAALAVIDQNNRSRIILDDGNNQQNIDPTRYPQGGLSASNTLRVGDTLPGLTGVMDFRFSNYRIQPVGAITWNHTNPRTAAPEPVGGNLKVASFNVLNFFNGDGLGGGFPTARGADTQAELDRQKAKEVSALKAIDADIVGLMEIENDAPPNSAIEELVAGLNAAMGAGTYSFIDTGVIGTDEIKVALIYKPASVSPVGAFKTITSATDPRFIDTLNRPSLAQTFEKTATGARLTVVVNHLKSKGSDCNAVGDPDTGDGSGNCNITRTNAAKALVDWLATDPTASGDPDFLFIGDFNSYTFEDPIDWITTHGFTNLVRAAGGLTPYSYVFNGESGYLDHALASGSLASQVTGVSDWHINPDEPTVLDYNVEFKTPNQVNTFYDPGPYRASDHDPVVIGLNVAAPPTVDGGGPYAVVEGGIITVSATGTESGGGSLTYSWDLDHNGTFETPGQSVTFSAAGLQAPLIRTISVQATGPTGLTATDDVIVNVIWAFDGFKPPTNNLPAVNEGGPGKLTLIFSLGGDQGLDIFKSGRPSSSSYPCGTTPPTDASEPAATVGAKGFRYDSGSNEYTFDWKASAAWKNTCRVFVLGLADGTTHNVAFHFK